MVTVHDYEIAPSAFDRTYTVALQANEGTKDAPDWVNVLPLTRQFTVAKKVSAHTVKVVPEADPANYTISLGKTTRPTLKAEVLGAGGETASYTTGKWSSSDTLIATINEDTGVVATTGTKVGAVTFTFTASFASGTMVTVCAETFFGTVNCRVRGRTFTQSGASFVPSLACSVTV